MSLPIATGNLKLIITEFQGMFFQLNCKVLTSTHTKKTKKQHNSTKTTTCKLYLVVICMFLKSMIDSEC